MAASLALLLSRAASRHPHLLFSPCPSLHHLCLAPPAASASPSPDPLMQLDELAAFRYEHSFPHGHLTVRPLFRGPDDDVMAEALVRLLASSFSETVRWARPSGMHSSSRSSSAGTSTSVAVLVGFYRPADTDVATEEDRGEVGEGEMAYTAEVSFDATGAPGPPSTPTPPLEFPYIYNMTVKMSFRRRGIGKQLLKACEDLVIKMDAKRRVYLHCRIIDQVPFNMYRTSGYNIVQTDSIFVWLSLQKRKHLMSKELAQASVGSEITAKDFDDNILTS